MTTNTKPIPKSPKLSHIDEIVAQSLKTSINRFREKPLLYFTESDIQTYLHKDLITGNTPKITLKDGSISLIHREYPTNFRYQKSKLIIGYPDDELESTSLSNKHIRSRGHFDLVVLNPEFIQEMLDKHQRINLTIEQIINKCVNRAIDRKCDLNGKHPEEILYAIEIKYLHMFNFKNKSMLDQILMDNEKLSIAQRSTGGFIKPINIVFSSAKSLNFIKSYMSNGKITHPSTGVEHQVKSGILNIYIEAYYDENNKKNTDKNCGAETAYCKEPQPWAVALCKKLKIKLNS